MIAPPMTAEEVEQARARVSSETQQIYTDAEKAVKAEIDRLDRAQKWAEGEMDRLSAAAVADVRDGKDPDAVRKQLDEDLQATIAKASEPGFDPRTLAPKLEHETPTPPPAIPVPQTPTPAAVATPPPSHVEATPTASACSCEEGGRPSLAFLVIALANTRRRRTPGTRAT